MSAAFSQKMFSKTDAACSAVSYNWYHHPNAAEVSGLLITARFEKALSTIPPIKGSPKLRKNADRLEEDATF
jgi:hypothetical protein